AGGMPADGRRCGHGLPFRSHSIQRTQARGGVPGSGLRKWGGRPHSIRMPGGLKLAEIGGVSENPSLETQTSGMIRHLFTAAVLLLPLQAADLSADICIYGGTSAGVVAAVQGTKMGKSVILLEPGQHLGSMASEGLGGTDIDNHGPFQNSPAVGGLALEYYRRIARAYGREKRFEEMLREGVKKREMWRFEPHVAEKVFDEWAAEAKVKVIRGARLADENPTAKEGPTLRSVRTISGDTVSAKVFIDATYEGDLLAAADVTCTVGREGNAKYGETLNGIVTTTKHSQFERKIDPYKTPGDPASGLIFGVSGWVMYRRSCFTISLRASPTRPVVTSTLS
ncbi:MAG: FAD-dependent oxidoreductase, partial [Verrucomicrobiaceae bacterium]